MSRDGMKSSQIAEEMGLAVETVKSQKNIAKKLLKEKPGKFIREQIFRESGTNRR